MNNKKIVIANMRTYIGSGTLPTEHTIASWANTLELGEQQTPPVAIGEPRAGESSVQPAAIVWDELRARAKAAKTDARKWMKQYERSCDQALIARVCARYWAFDEMLEWLDELSQTKQDNTD